MAGLPVVHCFFVFQGAFVFYLILPVHSQEWTCQKRGLLVWAGYSGIAALVVFCVVGTLGLLACWLFVRFAYAPMKVTVKRHLQEDTATTLL